MARGRGGLPASAGDAGVSLARARSWEARGERSPCGRRVGGLWGAFSPWEARGRHVGGLWRVFSLWEVRGEHSPRGRCVGGTWEACGEHSRCGRRVGGAWGAFRSGRPVLCGRPVGAFSLWEARGGVRDPSSISRPPALLSLRVLPRRCRSPVSGSPVRQVRVRPGGLHEPCLRFLRALSLRPALATGTSSRWLCSFAAPLTGLELPEDS